MATTTTTSSDSRSKNSLVKIVHDQPNFAILYSKWMSTAYKLAHTWWQCIRSPLIHGNIEWMNKPNSWPLKQLYILKKINTLFALQKLIYKFRKPNIKQVVKMSIVLKPSSVEKAKHRLPLLLLLLSLLSFLFCYCIKVVLSLLIEKKMNIFTH